MVFPWSFLLEMLEMLEMLLEMMACHP